MTDFCSVGAPGVLQQEQLKQLLEAVMNHKRPDGSFVSESFYRLPKRRNMPEYYEVTPTSVIFSSNVFIFYWSMNEGLECTHPFVLTFLCFVAVTIRY